MRTKITAFSRRYSSVYYYTIQKITVYYYIKLVSTKITRCAKSYTNRAEIVRSSTDPGVLVIEARQRGNAKGGEPCDSPPVRVVGGLSPPVTYTRTMYTFGWSSTDPVTASDLTA